jgi:SulP family sulfate permease
MKVDLKKAPSDLQAGLTVGLESIPDGMGSAILAGVNPINGLHAAMISITVGGILASSELVTITCTNAMDLAAGLALINLSEQARAGAMLTLTLLVGLFTVLGGIFRVGRLISLFSHAAMVGFISGAALLVILSRLGNVTGIESPYTNTLQQAFDVVLHLNQIDLYVLAIALLTLVLSVLIGRTPLKNVALVIAVAVASVVPIILGWSGIPQVSDIGVVSGVIPSFELPSIKYINLDLISWALAIAIIGMVQYAGISQATPNPDGSSPNISRDFIGQGGCNVAISFFRGMPTGGSISATALNVAAGAKTRLANISAGIFILVLLFFAGNLVLQLSIPALAAILMIAGYQAIKPESIKRVWKSSYVSRVEMIAVFAATMIFPLHYAVFLGVLLSALLHVYRSASMVDVVEIVPAENGTFSERPAPKSLPSNRPTILEIHGSLLYAGAWTVERKIPSPAGSKNAIVILRIHGQSEIGITLTGILERYSEQLRRNEGKLMIAGANPKIMEEMERVGMLRKIGKENVFPEGEVLEAGIRDALASASAMLNEKRSK